MTLGIVTDCIHYYAPDGNVCTENHILLRQLKQLVSHFEKAIVVCPFNNYDETRVVTFYNTTSINFYPLPNVGGNKLVDKLELLGALPKWIKSFNYLNSRCDIIYQRFPNNLNIPGSLFFRLLNKKVFATYTGTWNGYSDEAFTYKLQRWVLRNVFKGPVWVYDNPSNSSARIFSGFSPSYSLQEWEDESDQVENRIEKIRKDGINEFRFITVGTIIDYKNQLAIVETCKELKKLGFPFKLTIVGDGPMKKEVALYISENHLQQQVLLAGKKNHLQLRELYREHDFIIQAPLKEGFGKVPIEGFFHGVIPIINNISMASSMIGNDERGFLFNASVKDDLLTKLLSLPKMIEAFPGMIRNGRAYAKGHTLEAWAQDYFDKVTKFYSEN